MACSYIICSVSFSSLSSFSCLYIGCSDAGSSEMDSSTLPCRLLLLSSFRLPLGEGVESSNEGVVDEGCGLSGRVSRVMCMQSC